MLIGGETPSPVYFEDAPSSLVMRDFPHRC